MCIRDRKYPVGTKPRLALSLLLYTACRREDVVRLGPQHIRNNRGRFIARWSIRPATLPSAILASSASGSVACVAETPAQRASAHIVTQLSIVDAIGALQFIAASRAVVEL